MPATPSGADAHSSAIRWTGRTLSALPCLMFAFSAAMKFLLPPGSPEGFAHLGLPLNLAPGLGVLELTCTVLYVVPRTAVLGAVVLTGYLGGAIAIHLRVGDVPALHVLLGVMLWAGLWLRESRLRALLPLWR